MRKIKFRAWDEEEKMFIQFNKMGFWGDGTLWYLQGLDESEREIDPPYFEDENDWQLMQYTGIKDKNGVEIYEGDILKIELESHPDIYREVKDLYEMFVIDNNSDSVTVMGNIHEKPEILEGLR